jgi:hypothetical protein
VLLRGRYPLVALNAVNLVNVDLYKLAANSIKGKNSA